MPGQQADIEEILSRRHDNGADYWATPDGRIYVGNPFSTIGSQEREVSAANHS